MSLILEERTLTQVLINVPISDCGMLGVYAILQDQSLYIAENQKSYLKACAVLSYRF